jgi:hypothetical protein
MDIENASAEEYESQSESMDSQPVDIDGPDAPEAPLEAEEDQEQPPQAEFKVVPLVAIQQQQQQAPLTLAEEIKLTQEAIEKLEAESLKLMRAPGHEADAENKLALAGKMRNALSQVHKPASAAKPAENKEQQQQQQKPKQKVIVYKGLPQFDANKPSPSAEDLFKYLAVVENYLHARKTLFGQNFLSNFAAGIVHHPALSDFLRAKNLDNVNNLTVQQVRDAVLSYFGSAGLKTQLNAALANCTQKGSIGEYAFTFTNLINAIGSSEDDPIVAARFIDGIKDKALRSEVRKMVSINEQLPNHLQRDLKSIRDISAFAMSLESVVSEEKEPEAKAKPAVAEKAKEKSKLSNEKYCDFHHSSSHSNEECKKRKREDSSHDSSSSSSSNANANASKDSAAPNTKPRQECTFCHRRNHTVETCWKKKDHENNAGLDDSLHVLTRVAHPSLFSAQAATKRPESKLDNDLKLDDPALFAPISINDTSNVNAYLDSGASRSFISKTLQNKLKLSLIHNKAESFDLLNKHTLTSIGIAEVSIVWSTFSTDLLHSGRIFRPC